jgi:hypothetical protein
MPTEQPGVKHIEMPCMNSLDEPCKFKAFVQVVTVEDAKLQKKIDGRAMQKLRDTLNKEHAEGLHD